MTTFTLHDNGDSNDLVIDCGTCVMRRTTACTDCMVTFLLDIDDARNINWSKAFSGSGATRHPSSGTPAEPAMVFDLAEQRAMRTLSSAGLLPQLRYQAGN